MVETTENQICSFYLLKPYLLCVAILVPSIVLTSFLGLGLYAILFTTTILILSTSFLVKFTNKKRETVLVENPGSTKLQVEDEVEDDKILEPVLMKTVSDAAQEVDIDIVHEFQVCESLDLTSESESSDDSGSSENLELKWMISGNVEQNPEISDEHSTSEDDDDEEGLIEIDIPSNESTCLSEEPKRNLQSNLPTFLPESISQQQDLVEQLLAEINEVNEEENLIEIDISMGSIKYPAFEIEA